MQFQVTQVIVHQDYNYTILNNDIALLKLKGEVNYNNNVQPACLWFDQTYDQNNEEEIIGTVRIKLILLRKTPDVGYYSHFYS